MGWLYLGGRTIQEVGGEMMMGLSIYGVAVMDGSLYSRVYGILQQCRASSKQSCARYCSFSIIIDPLP